MRPGFYLDGLLPAAELALPGELLLLADGSGAGLMGVELPEVELSAGAVDEVDGEAGAGVLIGAASVDELEVAAGAVVDGVLAAESSVFLQPARAASTTAVANTVLRINMVPPVLINNVGITSRLLRLGGAMGLMFHQNRGRQCRRTANLTVGLAM